MSKLSKLLLIILSFAFLVACATTRNEYGIPIDQWQKLSKQDQQLIKQSYQPMEFNNN